MKPEYAYPLALYLSYPIEESSQFYLIFNKQRETVHPQFQSYPVHIK